MITWSVLITYSLLNKYWLQCYRAIIRIIFVYHWVLKENRSWNVYSDLEFPPHWSPSIICYFKKFLRVMTEKELTGDLTSQSSTGEKLFRPHSTIKSIFFNQGCSWWGQVAERFYVSFLVPGQSQESPRVSLVLATLNQPWFYHKTYA